MPRFEYSDEECADVVAWWLAPLTAEDRADNDRLPKEASRADLAKRYMAKYRKAFSETEYFRDDDVIGIGSGRAIHYFVDAFRHSRKKITATNVTLMSLTGTIYPEAPNQGQLYDADINTVEFARFFSQATRVRTISFPIAHEDIPSIRKNTWLHDRDDERFRDPDVRPSAREASLAKWEGNLFANHVPDISVVGVGVLGPDHRLWRELRAADRPSSKSSSSTMLDPIRKDLRQLIALSDDVASRASPETPYFPCADVCHRLVFIPPPAGVKLTPSEVVVSREIGSTDSA